MLDKAPTQELVGKEGGGYQPDTEGEPEHQWTLAHALRDLFGALRQLLGGLPTAFGDLARDGLAAFAQILRKFAATLDQDTGTLGQRLSEPAALLNQGLRYLTTAFGQRLGEPVALLNQCLRNLAAAFGQRLSELAALLNQGLRNLAMKQRLREFVALLDQRLRNLATAFGQRLGELAALFDQGLRHLAAAFEQLLAVRILLQLLERLRLLQFLCLLTCVL